VLFSLKGIQESFGRLFRDPNPELVEAKFAVDLYSRDTAMWTFA
jgi:hypothetical protein